MKTILVVLFAFGLLLICIQGDAKMFLLEEVTNGATDVSQPINLRSQAQRAIHYQVQCKRLIPIIRTRIATFPTKITRVRMIRMRAMEVMVILLDHQVRDTTII